MANSELARCLCGCGAAVLPGSKWHPDYVEAETAARAAEPEPPTVPADPEAEDIRRRQLARDGGLHGQAERLAFLNQRPDHIPGL